MLRFKTAVTVFHKFFLILVAFALGARAVPSAVAAQGYVIIDSQTGYVLQEKEAREKRQVGSLTKVATAAVVLDWAEHRSGNINEVATITPEAFVGTTENYVGFQPGDRIALRDLLYAALVQSDNIALSRITAQRGSERSKGSVSASPRTRAKTSIAMEKAFGNPDGDLQIWRPRLP